MSRAPFRTLESAFKAGDRTLTGRYYRDRIRKAILGFWGHFWAFWRCNSLSTCYTVCTSDCYSDGQSDCHHDCHHDSHKGTSGQSFRNKPEPDILCAGFRLESIAVWNVEVCSAGTIPRTSPCSAQFRGRIKVSFVVNERMVSVERNVDRLSPLNDDPRHFLPSLEPARGCS